MGAERIEANAQLDFNLDADDVAALDELSNSVVKGVELERIGHVEPADSSDG